MEWHTPIGIKDGKVVYASQALLADKKIMRCIMDDLGLIKRFPVVTDLSGKVVMVEGGSHEDAVRRYLSHAKS